MPVRKIVEIFLFRVLLGLFFVALLFLLGNLAKIMTAYAVISQVLFLFLQVVALLVGLSPTATLLFGCFSLICFIFSLFLFVLAFPPVTLAYYLMALFFSIL